VESAAPTYWLTRFCFQRALAFIYLLAFGAAAHQFRPLLGEHGLLPVHLFLKRVSFWETPSIFWLNSSDRVTGAAALVGVGLALFALSGLSERFGVAVSAATWFLLWVLYLSFVNVGQVFYGFGWETMLLEAGFLAIFFGSADVPPPVLVVWYLRWMLFRLMFGAGLIKLRGDPCWRDLTCMFYHYETQPIPNPLSWAAHRFPPLVHQAGTLFTHAVEIAAPWFYFWPGRAAALAGLFTLIFQGMLILSGNLSWLNYLTIAVAISCFDDSALSRLVPFAAPAAPQAAGLVRRGVLAALAALVFVLSIRPAMNLFSSRQLMNASFEPLHLVNTYGAFGSITKERYEIVVEGTDEAVLLPATRWREYAFLAKPGDPARRPPLVAPYHLRLDWLMWFAAMGPYQRHPWFVNLVAKLLQGDRAVQGILAENPFPDAPPRYVRARLYRYRFTTPREKRETGNWWAREPAGEYFPAVSLGDRPFCLALEAMGWL
jgi:hypothetical protein